MSDLAISVQILILTFFVIRLNSKIKNISKLNEKGKEKIHASKKEN